MAATALGLSLWGDDVPDMFVDNVQSATRTQFVDTGIVPKSGTRVELDFALHETGSNQYYPVMAGVKNASGQEVRVVGYTYGIRAYLNGRYSGMVDYKGNLARYNTVTTFVNGNSTYVQDGVQQEDPPDEKWHCYFGTLSVPDCTGLPIYLFAQNNNGTADCQARMSLYGAKIWQKEGADWVLKRDYRPCIKDGRAGLYDEVSQTIFYSGSSDDLASNVHTVFPTTTNGMTPGQQITNAVAKAISGDVIYFKKGTYTFGDDEYTRMWGDNDNGFDKLRVWLNKANISFVGEDTSSRTTWTEGAEPVIIDVNGGRFFIAHGVSGITFRGLTFTGANQTAAWRESGGVLGVYYGGFTASNCVFRGNAAWRGGACGGTGTSYYDCLFKNNSSCSDVNQSTGGAIKDAEVVKDCDFIANDSQSAGAIKDAKLIDNCTFKYNRGLHNGYNCAAVHVQNLKAEIRNCLFEANTNVADKTGGILRFEAGSLETAVANDYSLFVSNCTFKANFAQSHNGWSYGIVRSGYATDDNGGLRSRMVCEDCTFEDNYCKGGFCGAVYGITAKRCTFKGNHGDDDESYIWGDGARASDLYDCDIADGEITGCSLTRCTLHDVTSRGVFYGKPSCYVTNCLIGNCKAQWAVAYQSEGSEFVNCTFAHNQVGAGRCNYIYEYSYNATNVNCVYYGNTNASGSAFSVGVHAADDIATIRFVNCAFGPGKQSGLQYDADCFDIVNPKFAGDPRYVARFPGLPAFAPLPGSPLCGRALTLAWTADDLDLAGNGRMRDGKVDVGCYQCWQDAESMVILLR